MDPVNAGDLSFVDYLRPVWRFKFLVVLVVVAAAAVTYVYTSREPKTYQASAALYVGQSSLQRLLNPTTLPTNVIADDAALVTTVPVAQAVKAKLKLPYAPDALLGAVSASPNTGSDFITITAQGSDPQLVAQLANGFATQYIKTSTAAVVRSARSALTAAERQLRKTRGANSPALQGLVDEVATLESAVNSPPSAGQLVMPASVPGAPSSPHPTRNAVFAAAIALVLAIILCYLFDRRDRRIRSLTEFDSLFDVPVLATLPHVRRSVLAKRRPIAVPKAFREPHRTLRVNLELARETLHDGRVIVVTSALPSEGKSTIVRNLALTYRDAGARVAVVESDLRRPVLASQFDINPAPGLSEAFVLDAEPVLQRVPGSEQLNGSAGTLDVLVAGGVSEDPTVLLTDQRLRVLIKDLADSYDLVLVDTPPVLLVGDPLPLLSLADGVILVARAGTVTYPAVARLRRTIDRVDRVNVRRKRGTIDHVGRVNVLGVVANDVADDVSRYFKPYARDARGPFVGKASTTREHAPS